MGIGRLEAFLAPDGEPPSLDGLEVLLRRADVPPPPAVAVRMRACAEPPVRPALPVAEVMDALEPRLRPVRDLVVLVAGVRQEGTGELEHVRLEVGVGSGHE